MGAVFDIQRCCIHDGPGIRTTVFLKGCNLRCRYCHNVDTWDPQTDNLKSADEILENAERYREYWGDEGGITVSGGEPLLQIAFLIDFFRKAKAAGINTWIDTALQPFSREEAFFAKFRELMNYTDLLLVDIKHINREEHIKLTGRPNDNIKDAMKYLSEISKPIWIRHVLVPGITDNDEYLRETRAFIDGLDNVKKVEVLPYHSMGAYKFEELGIEYSLKGVDPPSKERIENAEKILNGQAL